MADNNHSRRLFLSDVSWPANSLAFNFAVRGAVLADWGDQLWPDRAEGTSSMAIGANRSAISIIIIDAIIDHYRLQHDTMWRRLWRSTSYRRCTAVFLIPGVLYFATFLYFQWNGGGGDCNPVVAGPGENRRVSLTLLRRLARWHGSRRPAGDRCWLKAATSCICRSNVAMENGCAAAPTILFYGASWSGLRFPVQERVEAGVSYRNAVRRFGWGSAYIVSFLIIMGVSRCSIARTTIEVSLPSSSR